MIPKTIKHENWFNEQDEWCNNKIFMFTCVTTMACTKRWLKKELIWKEPSLKCKNIKKKIERGEGMKEELSDKERKSDFLKKNHNKWSVI